MGSYHHTQVSRLTLVLLGMFGALIVAMLAWERFPLVPSMIAALMVLVVLSVSSLTVTVTMDHVACRFGFGPVARRFPLDRIRAASAVRNHWWYGWGIRMTPHGRLYNVAGLDAIELELSDGKRVRIGTDEPTELLRAIREHLAMRGERP